MPIFHSTMTMFSLYCLHNALYVHIISCLHDFVCLFKLLTFTGCVLYNNHYRASLSYSRIILFISNYVKLTLQPN